MQTSTETKAALRNLKIKAGTLRRNMKDYDSYKKEKAALELKVENLKAAEGTEAGIISRAESEVAETSTVLILTWTRIETALDELKTLMSQYDGADEVTQV